MILYHSDEAPKKWDSEDAQALKNFLNSKSGTLFLEWLVFESPVLLDGSDVNKTLVASGEVKGYQDALNCIILLTKEQPAEVKQKENQTYPSLDDDAAWKEADQSTTT